MKLSKLDKIECKLSTWFLQLEMCFDKGMGTSDLKGTGGRCTKWTPLAEPLQAYMSLVVS